MGQSKMSRGLRPMLWWLLLVLILFLIHLHQQWMERTRLYFSISSRYRIAVTFDGKPIQSGDNISLGSHRFDITSDDTDPFTADFFAWYGKHDLGEIQLKRSYGTLAVSATPTAQSIFIRGSEFSTNLQNSSGAAFTVPTDAYNVSVQYRHWNDSQTATVTRNANAPVTFAPRFGALHVSANYKDTTFQFQDASGQQIESGDLPKTLVEIPAGSYQLFATHHNRQLQKVVAVTAGATNDAVIEFQYGKAVIQSSPSGASVYGGDRSYLGQTPMELPEVTPQTLHFQIDLNGYQSVPGMLNVVANQTATFRTNLVSLNYIGAMSDARNNLAQGNYEQALTLVNQAIQSKPDDAEALVLQKKIEVAADIQQAEHWATGRSNYVNAVKFLEKALAIEPDNEKTKAMLAHDKPLVPEQIERERVERLNRPHEVFVDALKHYPDADLFEEHELTTGKPFKEAGSAIALALKSGQPAFQVTGISSPQPETYEIEAIQNVGNILINGQRQCLIVCGQSTDGETQIWFKVLEYKKHTSMSIQGGLTVNEEEIPIHSSKIQMTEALQAQLTNGVQIVTEKIKQVIAE